MKQKTIQPISVNALCTACGACSGICPTDAIAMQYNPSGYLYAHLDEERCIDCGKCVSVCPSVSQNTPHFDYDPFHGLSLTGYVGYAVDEEIRLRGQSGGIVTALLCYLLESNRIDGAMVNKFDQETGKTKVVYEDTIEGIKEGSGSYYIQSAVSKSVFEHQDKRTAAVVLGCQAESITLAENQSRSFRKPEYLIGLICAGQYSANYIDSLLTSANVGRPISNFRFKDKRAGGWPGDILIEQEERATVIPKKLRHEQKPLFENFRCIQCFDKMNIYSDIVVGDPWGIEEKAEPSGNSVVIARTQKGVDLIEAAVAAGYIRVESLLTERIIAGQQIDGLLKNQFYTAMEWMKSKEPLSPYNQELFAQYTPEQLSLKQKKNLFRRLQFSRSLYLEPTKTRYQSRIEKKSEEIKRQRICNRILRIPKRMFRLVFR
ncbi:MAG: Coenzyme F420 hydrogenase/dehydrogenase, beta subunit C-terminal domain [Sphaerochaeta sp.]